MAAISFLDAWAYMMYNGSEKDVPDVDSTIPPVDTRGQLGPNASSVMHDPVEEKYGIKTDLFSITSDPKNKNWVQGAPPVFLNNEAPLHSRVLDAVSCAVRTCCDFANTRFATLAKDNITEAAPDAFDFGPEIVDALFRVTSSWVLSRAGRDCILKSTTDAGGRRAEGDAPFAASHSISTQIAHKLRSSP